MRRYITSAVFNTAKHNNRFAKYAKEPWLDFEMIENLDEVVSDKVCME